ncbi:MAG: T9SS type A sorting domain-containing protein [Bacteroidales bacterium]|nr:T9SS type A sorting domain-containing protein [Bacteroidales bacterium]
MRKHLLFISFLLLGALFSQAQWQSDVPLTNDPGSSQMDGLPNAHCIASSGDTVHVVWKDNRDGTSNEIYYKRSVDGGLSWSPDTRISNNVFTSTAPSLSVSGSVVIIVWSDKRDGIYDNNYEIYYSRSTDGGTSWGTDTRLTNDPAQSDSPSVSVSGQLVFVVWDDYREVTTKSYYKRSTDGGISWGPDTKLIEPGGSPSVSVSGSVVNVVWNALGKTSYKRSKDGGLTWEASILLSIDNVITNSPSLSVSGSSVRVAWLDSRNSFKYEIYYKHSADSGITWETDTRLTTNYTSSSLFSSIAASGSDVHVVWDDNREGNYEIYYKGSKDGGLSWGADTRLTNNAALSMHPYISSSVRAVHVVWTDTRDGSDIYYKRNLANSEVGLKELSSSDMQFTVSPNPASSEIKVRSLENISELSISDIYGKQIYYTSVLNSTPELHIPTSGFPAGIYLIRLKNGERISVQKFIKL